MVSASVGRPGRYGLDTYMVLISGSSADGSGAVLARNGVTRWVLAAGTYTIEATTIHAGHTGDYTVGVSRDVLTPCVQDLGSLDSATSVVVGVRGDRAGS